MEKPIHLKRILLSRLPTKSVICRVFWFIIGHFFCVFAFYATLNARPQRLEPNIREACRLDLTGAYANAYDEKERTRHLLRALKEQLKKVDETLKKTTEIYKKAKLKNQEATYDRNTASSLDEAYAINKSYEDQRPPLLQQIRETEADHQAALAKEKLLRQSLEPLLTLQRFEDRPDGGYPIESHFRSPCPPFRAQCILPQKDVELLAKIRIDGKLPESCARYLTLGRSPLKTEPPH